MVWTAQLEAFIAAHTDADPVRLLLAARRHPNVDVPFAALQIELRQRLRSKLPQWVASSSVILPSRLAAEQCSSEATARYKRRLVVGTSLCDLTGGLGIDCYYMSEGLERVRYVERNTDLAAAATHNFGVLGRDIEVVSGDGREALDDVFDTLYVDPARRAADGSRVYALEECEPDVVAMQDALTAHCRRLVVKLSPMADISRVLQQVRGVREVHVVALHNECKELLLVVEAPHPDEASAPAAPSVVCADLLADGERLFTFRWGDEANATCPLATDASFRYLYEPDVTLLKAGAFRLVGQRFGLLKMAADTHLYGSDNLRSDFSGRVFEVDDVTPFTSHLLKALHREHLQANVAARNFPLSADQLRARAAIRDGGDRWLYAFRHATLGPLVVRCRRLLLIVGLLLSLCVPTSVAAAEPQTTLFDTLATLRMPPLGEWPQGATFVCLDTMQSRIFQAEQGLVRRDDFSPQQLWTFEGIRTAENWLGQPETSLRFRAASGIVYRYVVGNTLPDLDAVPRLSGWLATQTLLHADSLLRGRQLYLLLADDRLQPTSGTASDAQPAKFVRVVVDSVTVGLSQAPLRLHLTRLADSTHWTVCAALPESPESLTAVSLQRLFALADPYLAHPDITPQRWTLICQGRVERDMTEEEVRLSLGKPYRADSHTSRQGLVRVWYFRDGRVLYFLDGRLLQTALQP